MSTNVMIILKKEINLKNKGTKEISLITLQWSVTPAIMETAPKKLPRN